MEASLVLNSSGMNIAATMKTVTKTTSSSVRVNAETAGFELDRLQVCPGKTFIDWIVRTARLIENVSLTWRRFYNASQCMSRT